MLNYQRNILNGDFCCCHFTSIGTQAKIEIYNDIQHRKHFLIKR